MSIKKKLFERKHVSKVEERPAEEIYYGFTFIENEHILSVDIVTVINPNVKEQENI